MRAGLWMSFLAAGTAVFAQQARLFDVVTFTPGPGYGLVQKPDGGGRVELTKTDRGSYCIAAIYASTPAAPTLEASFAAEWQAVMLKTIAPIAAPRPAIRSAGNTRAAAGRVTGTAGGAAIVAGLLVLDAGASVMSVLTMSPARDPAGFCDGDIEALLATMSIRQVARQAAPAPPPPEGGQVVIGPPPRTLTVADLAGEWAHSDGINTRYVDRVTGAYAGFESIHIREKWIISKDGQLSSDFFAIKNGRKIIEKASGPVTLSGGVLAMRVNSAKRYVLRGWLDTPAMTYMKLNGPWYDDPIPANIFTNPQQGANLDEIWVRKK